MDEKRSGRKTEGVYASGTRQESGRDVLRFSLQGRKWQADPSLETLKRLAKALKVKVAELVADE